MKNSAGVKFNDLTELIIEAEPTGEVTSCRNLINGIEYIGGGGDDIILADFKVINNTSGQVEVNGAFCTFNEYDEPQYTSGAFLLVFENEEITQKIAVYHGHATIRCVVSSPDTISISGDITAGYGGYYDVTGNATLTINQG